MRLQQILKSSPLRLRVLQLHKIFDPHTQMLLLNPLFSFFLQLWLLGVSLFNDRFKLLKFLVEFSPQSRHLVHRFGYSILKVRNTGQLRRLTVRNPIRSKIIKKCRKFDRVLGREGCGRVSFLFFLKTSQRFVNEQRLVSRNSNKLLHGKNATSKKEPWSEAMVPWRNSFSWCPRNPQTLKPLWHIFSLYFQHQPVFIDCSHLFILLCTMSPSEMSLQQTFLMPSFNTSVWPFNSGFLNCTTRLTMLKRSYQISLKLILIVNE